MQRPLSQKTCLGFVQKTTRNWLGYTKAEKLCPYYAYFGGKGFFAVSRKKVAAVEVCTF